MEEIDLRIHGFMEKFMTLRRLMRRTQRKENNTRFLLIIIHSIEEGKPVMVSQLSQKMEITNAASTQMVDSMVKHGWVSRTQDEHDRRIMWVELTDEGKRILNETYQESKRFMKGMFDYLGEEDVQNLDRILDKAMEYALSVSEPKE